MAVHRTIQQSVFGIGKFKKWLHAWRSRCFFDLVGRLRRRRRNPIYEIRLSPCGIYFTEKSISQYYNTGFIIIFTRRSSLFRIGFAYPGRIGLQWLKIRRLRAHLSVDSYTPGNNNNKNDVLSPPAVALSVRLSTRDQTPAVR